MKKVNIEVILKIMVLLVFFLFYFALLRDNTIINYVHPRIVPYAKISLVLMGIILLFLIFNIFKEKMVRRSLRKYVIFLVPLIVFIVVGNNGLSSTAKIQEEKNKFWKGCYYCKNKEYVLENAEWVDVNGNEICKKCGYHFVVVRSKGEVQNKKKVYSGCLMCEPKLFK